MLSTAIFASMSDTTGLSAVLEPATLLDVDWSESVSQEKFLGVLTCLTPNSGIGLTLAGAGLLMAGAVVKATVSEQEAALCARA